MKVKYATAEEKKTAKRDAWRKYRAANIEKERERHRGYYAANLEKVRERERAYRVAHPEIKRASKLRRKYGLSPEDYQQLFDSQEGGCALCHRLVKLCVDHDHETGRVRGLLCNECNFAIGVYERHQRPARLIITPYETYLKE